MDFQEVHDFAVVLAKKAGDVMREASKKKITVQHKSSPADLLTETDLEVENLVREAVAKNYPTHRFIGEESTYTGTKCKLTDTPTWIVDPVDGTTNFVHSFPNFCISIGITYKKELVIGVIYNPLRDNLYTAIKDKGAFLNSQPIKVSDTTEIKSALIMYEFGSSKVEEHLKVKVRNVETLIHHCHGLRSVGSAAINMAAVACGQADAYVEHGLHCWDVAGMAVVVKEAGGCVMDPEVRSMGSAALNMANVACGEADAYIENGIHCWDMAAATVILREAGGCVMDPEGGELDIMSRRVLCASTKELCLDIIPHLEHLKLERD